MTTPAWLDRLEQALERSGKTARSASLKANLSPGYLHGILKEGKQPSLDRLLALVEALDVSLMWVVYGVQLSAPAERLLELYASLSSEQQTEFLRMAESLAKVADKTAPAPDE